MATIKIEQQQDWGINTTDVTKEYVDGKTESVLHEANRYTKAVNERLEDKVAADLKAEQTAREAADDKLQKAIEAEAKTRETNDNSLQSNIDSEASTREQADTALGGRIDAEKQARTDADTALGDRITQEAQAREQGDTDLEEKITAEQTAREEADTDLEGKITAEQTAREQADSGLDTKITENKTAIATNTTNIATNTAGIKKINDTTVVKSVAIDETASTDAVKVNVGSGTIGDGTSTKTLPLPVASATQAGVMNAATFNAIEGMKEGMNALANEAVAVSGKINDQSEQATITQAWKEASGSEYDTPIPGASIFDSTNEVMFRYYGNTKTWELIQDGLAAQIDLSQFTNTKAGLIKGSQTAGQVFAESDGTGSVNGWDDLTSDVSDLKTNSATKAELTSGLATKQNTLKAGTNIKIDAATNTISATDTTYKNGTGLLLTGNTFSVDNTIATNTGVDSKITNALKSYTTTADLNTALGKKQNTIKAGNNISINSDGVTINSSVPDLGVTTGKLANGAVTNDKLGAAAVKSDNIDWTTIPCFVSHKKYSYSDTIDLGKTTIWEHLDIHKYFPTIDVDRGNLVASDGLNIVLKEGVWDIRAMIFGEFNKEKPDTGSLLFAMLASGGDTLDRCAYSTTYYQKRYELESTVKGPVNVQLFLGNYLSEEDIFHLFMSRLSVYRVG